MPRHSMGEFEHLILLAVIRLGEEAFGVPIIREVEARTGREVSQAAAYLTLRRLEEKGWVAGRPGESTSRRGGRAKRYYTVTEIGRQKLREARNSLLSMWTGIAEELR